MMEPVKSHDPNTGHPQGLQQSDIDILGTEIPRPRVFSDSTDDLLLASDVHAHDDTASQTETDSLHAPTRAPSPHRDAVSGPSSSNPTGCPSSPRAMQLHLQLSEDSASSVPSQESPGPQLADTPSPTEARTVAKDSKSLEPKVYPSEIEMDDLQLSSTGTWTTKSTWRSEKNKQQQHQHAAGNRQPKLNYKPVVLRLPYQALLLFIIAGFFAFLEYEIHSLPQPYVQFVPFSPGVIHENSNFGLLDIQQPETTASPASRHRGLSTAHLAPTSTTTGVGGWTASRTTSAPLNTAMLMARGKLTANPEPIPPSSVYPTPGVSITKYFGWGPPAWYAAPRYDLSNDENVTWSFYQWIPFFTTKSEVPLSWCPCNVDLQVSLESGDLWIFRPSPGIALSGDASCQAIMNTLINFYRIMHQVSVFDTDDVPDYMRTMRNRAAALTWTTTPPAPVSIPWSYPITTNNEGAMVIALEVKTSTTLAYDVFGTAVTKGFPWTGFITASDGDHTRSTVLWTLPYSKPTASPLATTTSSMSSTKESAAPTSSSLFPASTETLTSTSETPTSSLDTTTSLPASSTTTQAQEESSGVVSISSSVYSTLTSTPVAPTTTTSEENTSTLNTSLQTSSENPAQITSSSQINSQISASTLSDSVSGSVASTLTSATVSSSFSGGLLTASSTTSSPTQRSKGSAVSNSNNPTAPTTDMLSPSSGFATGTSPEVSTAGSTTAFGQPLIAPPSPSSSSSTTSSAVPVVFLPPVVPFLGSFLGSLLGSPVSTTTTSTQSPSTLPATISSKGSPEGTNTPYPSPSGSNPTEAVSAGTDTGLQSFNTAPPPTATAGAQPDATHPGNTIGQAQVTASPTGHPYVPPKEPTYPEGPVSPNDHFFNLQTEADYLLASLVPVLLATLLSIPIQVFTSSINHMLPFKALRYPTGATAEDSLSLPRGSLLAPIISLRFLHRFKDPLPILNVLLGLLSTLLVPLSSETVRLEYLPFECHPDHVDGQVMTAKPCPVGLRVSGVPTRAAEALLAVIAAVIALMAYLLWRWRSGLATEPWSIAAMASMLSSSGSELKALMASMPPCADGVCLRSGEVEKTLKGRRFRLGGPETRHGEPTDNKGQAGHGDDGGGAGHYYGIHTIRLPEAEEDAGEVRLTAQDPPRRRTSSMLKPRTSPASPFDMEFFGRIVFLVFIGGLLILILYYENSMLNTKFETFMDSQTFGVRILFTGMGSIVSIFWDFQFSRIAENQLYHRLTKRPQPAPRSILLSPPSSVFTGLYSALATKDLVSANVSLATLLAKFTPILLSNIPFRNTVTWKTHEACTWLAVAVLSYMFIVLFASLWVRRAYMPVAPSSIAACMYYVCDSAMLKDFEGLVAVGRKERDRLVGGGGDIMGLGVGGRRYRYIFGEIVGVKSGERRIAVDYHRLEQRAAGWKPGRF